MADWTSNCSASGLSFSAWIETAATRNKRLIQAHRSMAAIVGAGTARFSFDEISELFFCLYFNDAKHNANRTDLFLCLSIGHYFFWLQTQRSARYRFWWWYCAPLTWSISLMRMNYKRQVKLQLLRSAQITLVIGWLQLSPLGLACYLLWAMSARPLPETFRKSRASPVMNMYTYFIIWFCFRCWQFEMNISPNIREEIRLWRLSNSD